MEMRSMHSWQIRWSLPWLWSELGHMVCTGLTGNWVDAHQDCYRYFHPLLVAWGMTIFQARVSPITKRFWVREVKPTEGTAFSQRHGLTSSGVGTLEFQTLCFESLYLPSSTSVISSIATAMWKLSFFWCKSTWTNSLSEIWSDWGLLCISKGILLLCIPQHCISPCHVDLTGFTWPSHQPYTVEMVASWLHQ